MSELGSDRSLELEVSNFGPIVNASIELRPLTVFIGPSNTGKTYLSTLIYALHRFFSRARSHLDWAMLSLQLPKTHREQVVPDESIDELLDLIRSGGRNGNANPKGNITLTTEIGHVLSSALARDPHASTGEILRCFGITHAKSLVRKGKSSATSIAVRQRIPGRSAVFSHDLTLTPPFDYKTIIPSEIPLPFELELDYSATRTIRNLVEWLEEDPRNSDRRQKFFVDASLLLGSRLASHAFGALHMPAYYLPADRAGLMQALRVMVSTLLSSLSSTTSDRTPLLSGVEGDFLEQLSRIDKHFGEVSTGERDFGSTIERDFLNGSVLVHQSPTNGPSHFAFRPDGWNVDLTLANASSMVSELVPLVLYLRYLIKPDNVLILEEPESHLHPGIQVELMRQLAILVNRGVRLIVTTHSEWFLEELSNIVRSSELRERRNPDAHDLDTSLKPEQVGVWLFNRQRRPKGAVVKEIQIDESGLFPSGYDEVAIQLHNKWVELTRQVENTRV